MEHRSIEDFARDYLYAVKALDSHKAWLKHAERSGDHGTAMYVRSLITEMQPYVDTIGDQLLHLWSLTECSLDIWFCNNMKAPEPIEIANMIEFSRTAKQILLT